MLLYYRNVRLLACPIFKSTKAVDKTNQTIFLTFYSRKKYDLLISVSQTENLYYFLIFVNVLTPDILDALMNKGNLSFKKKKCRGSSVYLEFIFYFLIFKFKM